MNKVMSMSLEDQIFFPFDDRSPANVVIEEIRDIIAPNGQFDKTSLALRQGFVHMVYRFPSHLFAR